MADPWDNREGLKEQPALAFPLSREPPENRGKFFTDSLVSRK